MADAKPSFRLVDVSQWPLVLVRVIRPGSIADEGEGLMPLETAISQSCGERVEVYLETRPDQNKARGEVAERVRDWQQRRGAMKERP